MKDDPIVMEIKMIREAHASRFHYDLRAIYEDIKKQERACTQELYRLPPKISLYLQPQPDTAFLGIKLELLGEVES